MPRTTARESSSAGGAENEEGRRPTLVSAPPAASPELVDRPRRRTFTAADKLRILGEVDRVAPGGMAAIRRSVAVRTFDDWNDPPPGFMETDLVAHSGPMPKEKLHGDADRHRDGVNEGAPVLVREQKLLREILREMCKILPPAARLRRGQRQRFHERDGKGLLRGSWGGVHAHSPLSQERPGVGGTEERRPDPGTR